MKRFCYHREFWMDFHFWILVLLLAAVALTMRAPLSVVSLAYLAFVGILILLQVFQPPVSIRQYPEGSYHFNWIFYRDTRLYIDLFLLAGLLALSLIHIYCNKTNKLNRIKATFYLWKVAFFSKI